MKKLYRATFRYDRKTHECKKSFENDVCRCVSWKRANGSEIARTLYKVLLDNKKLRNTLVKKVAFYLSKEL